MAENATASSEPDTSTSKELSFHDDFKLPIEAAILQADDGKCFRFNLYVLRLLSSFFSDLGDIPLQSAPGHETVRLIPLPSATAPGLALALNLVHGHIFPSQRRPVPWPSNETIDNLLDIVRAYDLPVAIEAFPSRTKFASSRAQCYQRLVVSFAIGYDELTVDIYGMAVLHGVGRNADEWTKNHIRNSAGTCVFELSRLNNDLDRLVATVERSTTLALLSMFSDDEINRTASVKHLHDIFESSDLPGMLLRNISSSSIKPRWMFKGIQTHQNVTKLIDERLRKLSQSALLWFRVAPQPNPSVERTHL